MLRRQLGTSLYAGLLFTVLGLLAWVSGQPFIFPSLGPSAFILAFEQRGKRTDSSRIVGSHLIGGVAGLVAYAVIAGDVSLTTIPPELSTDGLRLTLSAVVSMILTSWGMIATNRVHAPACATTLIVSLGLLSTPLQVLTIIVSIVILVEFHAGIRMLLSRLVDSDHALDAERSDDLKI
ncbi:HPP family protein [Halohasta litchfieldiae]|uniref:HPP family protein n=1 Tax=Halohasta litchfieldiae TaxID=1073996 RepID=A0A1H6Y0G7_9EURY|nr:HPP family protein [Halohasta litchfieldiae]ATW87305.1 HPP family protein [Halohasta litchfieldiae]SEJ34798.1 HPP family protein [Halohasta litchfieldiae]